MELWRSGHPCRETSLRTLLFLVSAPILVSVSLGAQSEEEIALEQRPWQIKVGLQSPDAASRDVTPARCVVRYYENDTNLSITCSHELGSDGEVMLVRAGSGARSEPPLWSAPLASPFDEVAALSDDALTTFLAGELALRIQPGDGGIVVESTLATPIFDSGFDYFSLCEWSNFPCPSDNNVCTYEYCSSTGVCSHINHSATCSPAHATGQCNNGICQITSCNSGYSNCNITSADGCEVVHDTGPGTCSTLVNFVGSYTGDTTCGPIGCYFNNNGHLFATRTGRGEAFYSAEVLEGSLCVSSIEHTVELIVPPGIDYDLFVYRGCQLVASSIGGTGVDEFIRVEQEDFVGSLEDFYYQVEVRYFSGSSCEEWELRFTGLTC